MHRPPLVATLILTLAACAQPSPQGAASAAAPPPSTPGSASPAAVSTNELGEPALTIDPGDATCSADADCVMTMTQCSCDCGSPVNLAHRQKYIDARERMCKGYQGRECKMSCTESVICDKGVCRIKK